MEEELQQTQNIPKKVNVKGFKEESRTTDAIRGILNNYQPGPNIFIELLQNADDAKASTIKFFLVRKNFKIDFDDESQSEDYKNQLKNIFDPKINLTLGPGLYVYDDGEFTEKNQQDISRISSEGKKEDITKSGKFGVGFRSVYHMTDVPCWISQFGVCYSDPLGLFVNPDIPDQKFGIQMDLDTVQQYPSVFKHFEQLKQYTFKDNDKDKIQGKLFRFGFRDSNFLQNYIDNKTKDSTKLLKEEVINSEEMRQWMEDFIKTSAQQSMLFLKHVQNMEFYDFSEYSEEPTMIYQHQIQPDYQFFDQYDNYTNQKNQVNQKGQKQQQNKQQQQQQKQQQKKQNVKKTNNRKKKQDTDSSEQEEDMELELDSDKSDFQEKDDSESQVYQPKKSKKRQQKKKQIDDDSDEDFEQSQIKQKSKISNNNNKKKQQQNQKNTNNTQKNTGRQRNKKKIIDDLSDFSGGEEENEKQDSESEFEMESMNKNSKKINKLSKSTKGKQKDEQIKKSKKSNKNTEQDSFNDDQENQEKIKENENCLKSQSQIEVESNSKLYEIPQEIQDILNKQNALVIKKQRNGQDLEQSNFMEICENQNNYSNIDQDKAHDKFLEIKNQGIEKLESIFEKRSKGQDYKKDFEKPFTYYLKFKSQIYKNIDMVPETIDYDWLLVCQIGGKKLLTMFKQQRNDEYDFRPYGSVAFCLNHKISTGQAFCMLPLPQFTGLPFHINGCFMLPQNRTHIISETTTGTINSAQNKNVKWNKFLLEEIVGNCARLGIEFISQSCQQQKNYVLFQSDQQKQFDIVDLVPLIKNLNQKSFYEQFCESIIQKSWNLPIFRSSNQKLVTGQEAIFVNQIIDNEAEFSISINNPEINAYLKKIIECSGFQLITNLNPDVLDQFSSQQNINNFQKPKVLNPQMLCKILQYIWNSGLVEIKEELQKLIIDNLQFYKVVIDYMLPYLISSNDQIKYEEIKQTPLFLNQENKIISLQELEGPLICCSQGQSQQEQYFFNNQKRNFLNPEMIENCQFIKKLSNLVQQQQKNDSNNQYIDTEKLNFTNLDVKSFIKLMALEYQGSEQYQTPQDDEIYDFSQEIDSDKQIFLRDIQKLEVFYQLMFKISENNTDKILQILEGIQQYPIVPLQKLQDKLQQNDEDNNGNDKDEIEIEKQQYYNEKVNQIQNTDDLELLMDQINEEKQIQKQKQQNSIQYYTTLSYLINSGDIFIELQNQDKNSNKQPQIPEKILHFFQDIVEAQNDIESEEGQKICFIYSQKEQSDNNNNINKLVEIYMNSVQYFEENQFQHKFLDFFCNLYEEEEEEIDQIENKEEISKDEDQKKQTKNKNKKQQQKQQELEEESETKVSIALQMTVWEENENIFEVLAFLGQEQNGFIPLLKKQESLRKRIYQLPIFYNLEKSFISIQNIQKVIILEHTKQNNNNQNIENNNVNGNDIDQNGIDDSCFQFLMEEEKIVFLQACNNEDIQRLQDTLQIKRRSYFSFFKEQIMKSYIQNTIKVNKRVLKNQRKLGNSKIQKLKSAQQGIIQVLKYYSNEYEQNKEEINQFFYQNPVIYSEDMEIFLPIQNFVYTKYINNDKCENSQNIVKFGLKLQNYLQQNILEQETQSTVNLPLIFEYEQQNQDLQSIEFLVENQLLCQYLPQQSEINSYEFLEKLVTIVDLGIQSEECQNNVLNSINSNQKLELFQQVYKAIDQLMKKGINDKIKLININSNKNKKNQEEPFQYLENKKIFIDQNIQFLCENLLKSEENKETRSILIEQPCTFYDLKSLELGKLNNVGINKHFSVFQASPFCKIPENLYNFIYNKMKWKNNEETLPKIFENIKNIKNINNTIIQGQNSDQKDIFQMALTENCQIINEKIFKYLDNISSQKNIQVQVKEFLTKEKIIPIDGKEIQFGCLQDIVYISKEMNNIKRQNMLKNIGPIVKKCSILEKCKNLHVIIPVLSSQFLYNRMQDFVAQTNLVSQELSNKEIKQKIGYYTKSLQLYLELKEEDSQQQEINNVQIPLVSDNITFMPASQTYVIDNDKIGEKINKNALNIVHQSLNSQIAIRLGCNKISEKITYQLKHIPKLIEQKNEEILEYNTYFQSQTFLYAINRLLYDSFSKIQKEQQKLAKIIIKQTKKTQKINQSSIKLQQLEEIKEENLNELQKQEENQILTENNNNQLETPQKKQKRQRKQIKQNLEEIEDEENDLDNLNDEQKLENIDENENENESEEQSQKDDEILDDIQEEQDQEQEDENDNEFQIVSEFYKLSEEQRKMLQNIKINIVDSLEVKILLNGQEITHPTTKFLKKAFVDSNQNTEILISQETNKKLYNQLILSCLKEVLGNILGQKDNQIAQNINENALTSVIQYREGQQQTRELLDDLNIMSYLTVEEEEQLEKEQQIMEQFQLEQQQQHFMNEQSNDKKMKSEFYNDVYSDVEEEEQQEEVQKQDQQLEIEDKQQDEEEQKEQVEQQNQQNMNTDTQQKSDNKSENINNIQKEQQQQNDVLREIDSNKDKKEKLNQDKKDLTNIFLEINEDDKENVRNIDNKQPSFQEQYKQAFEYLKNCKNFSASLIEQGYKKSKLNDQQLLEEFIDSYKHILENEIIQEQKLNPSLSNINNSNNDIQVNHMQIQRNNENINVDGFLQEEIQDQNKKSMNKYFENSDDKLMNFNDNQIQTISNVFNNNQKPQISEFNEQNGQEMQFDHKFSPCIDEFMNNNNNLNHININENNDKDEIINNNCDFLNNSQENNNIFDNNSQEQIQIEENNQQDYQKQLQDQLEQFQEINSKDENIQCNNFEQFNEQPMSENNINKDQEILNQDQQNMELEEKTQNIQNDDKIIEQESNEENLLNEKIQNQQDQENKAEDELQEQILEENNNKQEQLVNNYNEKQQQDSQNIKDEQNEQQEQQNIQSEITDLQNQDELQQNNLENIQQQQSDDNQNVQQQKQQEEKQGEEEDEIEEKTNEQKLEQNEEQIDQQLQEKQQSEQIDNEQDNQETEQQQEEIQETQQSDNNQQQDLEQEQQSNTEEKLQNDNEKLDEEKQNLLQEQIQQEENQEQILQDQQKEDLQQEKIQQEKIEQNEQQQNTEEQLQQQQNTEEQLEQQQNTEEQLEQQQNTEEQLEQQNNESDGKNEEQDQQDQMVQDESQNQQQIEQNQKNEEIVEENQQQNNNKDNEMEIEQQQIDNIDQDDQQNTMVIEKIIDKRQEGQYEDENENSQEQIDFDKINPKQQQHHAQFLEKLVLQTQSAELIQNDQQIQIPETKVTVLQNQSESYIKKKSNFITCNKAEEITGIKILYNPEQYNEEDIENKQEEISQLAVILKNIAIEVLKFKDLSTIGIVLEKSRTIAFNISPSHNIYFNVNYLQQSLNIWNKNQDLTKEQQLMQTYTYWYTTFCHELAHNIEQEHNRKHEKYMQDLIVQYMPYFMELKIQNINN